MAAHPAHASATRPPHVIACIVSLMNSNSSKLVKFNVQLLVSLLLDLMAGKLRMLARFSLCLLLAFDLMSNTKAHSHSRRSSLTTRSDSQCQPFQSNLGPSSVSSDGSKDFVAISPSGSYSTSGNGLELYLKKPKGSITTKDRVNDKIGDGATINSTFTLRSVHIIA